MSSRSVEIRVRGRVQGVGFRPTVYRLAKELDLAGDVRNDADGVLVHVTGSPIALASFLERLEREAPPLARIASIETRTCATSRAIDFRIVESARGETRTEIAPDTVVCTACTTEVVNAEDRRFGYPFTTCTHCGPRLTIVVGIPYDRAQTTMAAFPLCEPCGAEYRDPDDRRFHAEATACPACGPKAHLVRTDARTPPPESPIVAHPPLESVLDAVDAAREVLERGAIVAIKGLGGYHLACDATLPAVVARLRERKRRDAKPFAVMARDLAIIRRYCSISSEEEEALRSAEGPIVLLRKEGPDSLPDGIAPSLETIGFMLPTTPLHTLLLRQLDRPLVMTSGNVAEEPPVIADADMYLRLADIADHALVHDRSIANRVDDSVVREMDGRMRVLRRARGYVPSPIRLPGGFENAPPLLAYGADLKSTFCLLSAGRAVLSQHHGDLDDDATLGDYERSLALYTKLFDHVPRALVTDLHPDYASSVLARARAEAEYVPLVVVQHHHAHVAACLAENAWPLDGPRVLGIVLDGLGLGDDGALWGGEFLLADYRSFERVGTFKPVAMIGGDAAAREPWRNLYAHLVAEMGWEPFSALGSKLEVHRRLAEKPRTVLDRMLASGTNVRVASSCGRLFDAFAALAGVVFERQSYEAQAGPLLEALASGSMDDESAYPFAIEKLHDSGLPYVEPLPMWRAALVNLVADQRPGVMAARFHRGLARAIVAMVTALRNGPSRFDTVALSGGCFQNRILFEAVAHRVRAEGLLVLTHESVPPNDGGLSLGQAAVGAARLLAPSRP